MPSWRGGDDRKGHRRSSSDVIGAATALTRTLSAGRHRDSLDSPPSSSSPSPSARKLAFFADRLNVPHAFHTKSHSSSPSPVRGQPRASPASDQPTAPAPLATMASPPSSSSMKMHPSPSKAMTAASRTYDVKSATRDLHRLGIAGAFGHLPAALAPALASAASASSLTLVPGGASGSSMTLPLDSAWAQLHVFVLPLFNGEPLQVPIEDLNVIVRKHIESVTAKAPSRALATLENDCISLINSGMVTMNTKLSGVDDEKILNRIVEIWGFFWDQVLPYVEGVLLPLQTEHLLLGLSRTKTKDSGATLSHANSFNQSTTIDVRNIALRAFRDSIIFPLYPKLEERLGLTLKHDRDNKDSSSSSSDVGSSYQQPRFQQMLLVLASVAQGVQRVSLTSPMTHPSSPQQKAIQKLLHIVLSQSLHSSAPISSISRLNGRDLSRAPTFTSGGRPRDRRGRIAQKPRPNGKSHQTPQQMSISTSGYSGYDVAVNGDDFDAERLDGDETPRNGDAFAADPDRELGRRVLESLKSPDLDADDNSEYASRRYTGGWGLGGGRGTYDEKVIDDDDEENYDWDQAQAVVERMVGMNVSPTPSTPGAVDPQVLGSTATMPAGPGATPTPLPGLSRRRLT